MINVWMTKMFGASWKPTVCGILSAFFGFVAASPSLFPHWLVEVSVYVSLGGLAGIGITSKGATVTGGDTPNTVNNPLVVSKTAEK